MSGETSYLILELIPENGLVALLYLFFYEGIKSILKNQRICMIYT
jgi:hypothetical protein